MSAGGGQPYIGSKISLISKSNIRYEGILFTVDTNESTVTLTNVRLLGTEDRPAEKPLPPRDEIYEYIIFRGGDIKDIHVCEMAKQEIPDPAIISQRSATVNQHQPSPSGAPGTTTPVPQATYQQPPPPPPPQFAPSVPFPPNLPNMPGGGPGVIGGGLLNRPGPSAFDHPSRGSTPPPPQLFGRKSPTMEQSNQIEDHQLAHPYVTSPPPRSNRGAAFHRSMGGEPRYSRPPPSHEADRRSPPGHYAGYSRGPQPSSGATGYNGPQSSNYNRPRYNNMGYSSRDGYEPGNRSAGVSRDFYDAPTQRPSYREASYRETSYRPTTYRPSASPARGVLRGGRGGGAPPGGPNRSREPVAEFDFEKANAKFDKDEVANEFKKLSLAAVVNGDDKPARAVDGEIVEEDGQDEDGTDSVDDPAFYDKDKSFFDHISCEALDKERKSRRAPTWQEEKQLNTQTFGVSSVHQNQYRRGGPWRGGGGYRGGQMPPPRGFRGGYSSQGYNNSYQQRGGYQGYRGSYGAKEYHPRGRGSSGGQPWRNRNE